MAKRQTRRAISVKGLTYQRVKKYCEENGDSISGFVEKVVNERLDKLGWPEETELKPRPTKPATLGNFEGSSFTF